MQFGHPVGARALEPDDDHDIAVQLALRKRLGNGVLGFENAAGRLDGPALTLHGGGFEAGAAEIALDQPHSAIGLERIAGGAEHVGIAALARIAPLDCVVSLDRFLRIGFEPAVPNGQDVAMC